MHRTIHIILAAAFAAFYHTASAQVPQIINYQGRINVGSTPFTGTGQFRFALVNGDGSNSFWSNDGTSNAGSAPTAAVSLPVANGLYVVPLGDAAIPNMQAVPATVFSNADVRLRVWFDDGTNGSQLLSPDQRITSVGYAMVAGTVPDGAITSAKLVAGAVTRATITSDTNVAAVVNTDYLLTSVAQATVTLPASPAIGDVVRIASSGAGGWKIAQNAGQSIMGSGSSLSNGNSIGASWSQTLNQSSNFYSIACSADGSRVIATTGSGTYFYSSDFGTTWVIRGAPVLNLAAVASSASGANLVISGVASLNGTSFMHTSSDYGVTWTQREVSRAWNGVASSADGTKLVAVVNAGQIYTSIDSGVTWTARDSTRNWRGVASSADGTKLVAVVSNGQIYTSTDSGVTWTPRESARSWRAVASSADGIKLVAAVGGGQIYTSGDSGVTWTARDSVRAWTSVASSSDGRFLIASENSSPGQIYTSSDSGVTWTARTSSSNFWFPVAISADGSRQYAGRSSIGIFVSSPGGSNGTTPGTSGYLTGGQHSAIELLYIGNNLFMPRSHEGTILAY